MGPAALLRQKKQDNPTEEESAYKKLRPRNIPRRHLQGYTVVDAYLNRSDSFKTIVESEDGGTTNKSGGDAGGEVPNPGTIVDDEPSPSTPRKEKQIPFQVKHGS